MTLRSSEDRQIRDAYRDLKTRERKASKRSRPAMVEKVGQQPRLRNNEHLKRIRRLPCLATLIRTGVEAYGVDAAHVRANYPDKGWGGNPGLACKPSDWRALPASRAEHSLQHSMNERAYWAALRIYPPHVCAALRDANTFEAMLNVIRNAARMAREVEG